MFIVDLTIPTCQQRSFETHGVSLRPFPRIESCSSTLHWGISSIHFLLASLVSAFRAIIVSQFLRSEPSSFLVQAFRVVIILSFGIQSHYCFSVSTFRAIIASQFRRSNPSPLPSSSVQRHHHFPVPAFRAIIIPSFGIQNHHRFRVSAFRATILSSSVFKATISSPFWRSKPSSFSVSTFRATIFLVQASRAIIASRFRRSEPLSPSLLGLGVQSHHLLSLGIQRHHLSLVLAFRATISSQFRRSEPPFLISQDVQSHHLFSSLTFRVTICLQFWGVSFVLWQSSLHSTHYSHFLFTLMFTFLTLMSFTEEGHICRPFFCKPNVFSFFLFAFIKKLESISWEVGDTSHEASCMDMWRTSVARP